jgi:NAD(P)H-dependent flavin oxidoreductase YrpB (nitropropane dioxygenase family)
MKTRITELLGIKHPIIQAGMNFVSYVPLAAAVSNAGGLGILTASDQTPEELRENIRTLKGLTSHPFGVNLVPYLPRYHAFCRVVLEERVPVFSHGLGDPFKLLDMKKPGDMIFMPTAGSLRQAIKMEKDGADALIVHGMEGGGHVGYIASSVLIPGVSESVKIPVVATGGFCDGKGLVAALALGADGIAMGTRFIATQECPVHPDVKEAFLKAKEEDTTVSSKYDGFRLRSIPGEKMRHYKGWWTRPWEIFPSLLAMKKGFKTSFGELVRAANDLRRYHAPVIQVAVGSSMVRNTLSKGEITHGVLPSGQVVGRVHDIPTCEELIQRIILEAEEIIKSMNLKLNSERTH